MKLHLERDPAGSVLRGKNEIALQGLPFATPYPAFPIGSQTSEKLGETIRLITAPCNAACDARVRAEARTPDFGLKLVGVLPTQYQRRTVSR